MATISNFNLRVYGLLIYNESVLLSEELRSGRRMIKFPGGGLEKGEGLKEGLIREFDEELGIIPELGTLFYVNDFLQVSAFDPKDQLISFYYFVDYEECDSLVVNQLLNQERPGDEQIFHWYPINRLDEVGFTFPIDQKVATNLLNRFKEES